MFDKHTVVKKIVVEDFVEILRKISSQKLRTKSYLNMMKQLMLPMHKTFLSVDLPKIL